jgi:hypothetical protein
MFDTLTTDRERYHGLQMLVREKLPFYAADMTLNAGYNPLPADAQADKKAKLKRLNNVKAGKVECLPDLVAMVRHCLPDFPIPAELLPAEEQAPATEQELATA